MSEAESEENESVLIFTTPILSSLWLSYDYDFRFSSSRKRSYDSDYDPTTPSLVLSGFKRTSSVIKILLDNRKRTYKILWYFLQAS